MPAKNKINWISPAEATATKQWWALKKYLLSKGPLTRITLASFVTCGLTILGFKFAFPNIVMPNLLPILFALPLLLGMMVLKTYANTRMGARVAVTPKKIVISIGDSSTIIKTESLTTATLAIHDNQKTRLRLRYDYRGKSRLKIVGVSSLVNLAELESILPIEITPRDYRRTKRATTTG